MDTKVCDVEKNIGCVQFAIQGSKAQVKTSTRLSILISHKQWKTSVLGHSFSIIVLSK